MFGICTEQNLSRAAAGRRGSLDPAHRVMVAARLAALTMVCGRTGIWVGHDHDVPEESALLRIGQVSGGVENVQDDTFTVNDEVIREVVEDTRLFTSQGENTFLWGHRTYAEFLAAHYLTVHDVPIEQIRSMLCHADVQSIVPQLRGMAAWLGARREVLDFIRVADAELLLNVDLTMHDAATRATAVDDLLAAARRGEVADFGLSPSRYGRLTHPGVAEQVRPVLRDRERVWTERRMAIDIAQECCVEETTSELLALALDTDEDIHHRTNALRALRRSTNSDIHAPIRQMLDDGLPGDADNDLRGVCLEILWPEAMSTADLVNYITPAQRTSYFGAYAGFLEHRFVEPCLMRTCR